MNINLLANHEEQNTFTGEPEYITIYGIDTKLGYFEMEIKNTSMNGVITLQAANWNIKTIENIYNYFDNIYDFELYLDTSGAYTYIDITTWGSPDDLDTIKDKILELLKNYGG